jgi:site-specific DNA recombinase
MASRTTNKRVKKAVVLGDDVRVALYERRSTDEENQPYTIDAQDTRMRSYVDSQPGWRVVKTYTDDASGASTKRDGLQRAMRAARSGVFDVLLVYRVDRFSRNLRDMVTLLDDLDQFGVVFRSATEPFDTSTPMGRMLVQMLGMFAQFERDVIIDRVVAGMERKAAQGKWRGGRRPFGYLVGDDDRLIPEPAEAAVVQLVFELYTRDRLGSDTIAASLNQRGLRTTTGNLWSKTQILRMLENRVYLGEINFREITAPDAHPALVSQDVFDQAARILDVRGETPSHCATNSSDYLATGRINCPRCGKPIIGTRATGKTKTYRYYTCWNRNRYGTAKCDYPRLNADALDAAILEAAAGFYRSQGALIAEAVQDAAARHDAQHGHNTAELDRVHTDLAKVGAKIDRYLDAFEDGKLDPESVEERLIKLRDQQKQLRHRRDELTAELGNRPAVPDAATLDEITEHITDVITHGDLHQQKSLVEALVAEVKITAPDRIIPVFRIPQPDPEDSQAWAELSEPALTSTDRVRAPHTLVGRLGLEPRTYGIVGTYRRVPVCTA